MQSLKEKAIDAISRLPDAANLDAIMQQIYVIGKIRNGQNAIKNNETLTIEEMQADMKQW